MGWSAFLGQDDAPGLHIVSEQAQVDIPQVLARPHDVHSPDADRLGVLAQRLVQNAAPLLHHQLALQLAHRDLPVPHLYDLVAAHHRVQGLFHPIGLLALPLQGLARLLLGLGLGHLHRLALHRLGRGRSARDTLLGRAGLRGGQGGVGPGLGYLAGVLPPEQPDRYQSQQNHDYANHPGPAAAALVRGQLAEIRGLGALGLRRIRHDQVLLRVGKAFLPLPGAQAAPGLDMGQTGSPGSGDPPSGT